MTRIRRFIAAVVLGFGLIPGTSVAEDVAPDILVSRQLLQEAHLAIGDTVLLAARANASRASRFRIVGVYEPIPDPLRFTVERLEARLHLSDLLALTADPADPDAAEAITAVNVRLANPSDAERFGADLSHRSLGLVGRPTVRPREGDPFAVLERFQQAIAVVTVLGSTLFLLALMIIRAEERRETVGMLRLIGVSRRSIVLGIIVESAVVALAGALFGVLVAACAQYGINHFFQARYDTALVFVKVTLPIAATCLLVALPLGIVTGAVASWTLLSRGPVELLGR